MKKSAQVHLHIAVLTFRGYSSYSTVPSPELCTLVSLPIHEES